MLPALATLDQCLGPGFLGRGSLLAMVEPLSYMGYLAHLTALPLARLMMQQSCCSLWGSQIERCPSLLTDRWALSCPAPSPGDARPRDALPRGESSPDHELRVDSSARGLAGSDDSHALFPSPRHAACDAPSSVRTDEDELAASGPGPEFISSMSVAT
jgi:hypothetical protein